MSFPLVFHPDVQPEIDEAHAWYEGQREGLGDEFLEALGVVFARLEQMPEMHQVVYKDIRRGLTRRFPYAVFYRVHSDRVEVVAVHHTSRDPASWQSHSEKQLESGARSGYAGETSRGVRVVDEFGNADSDAEGIK